MDPLPGKGLVRAFNVGAQGSMQAAGAPWQALGNVGEVISSVGEKGIELLNKHKALQIQREAADMELEFDQLQQDYEMEVLKNPNMTPEQALEGWSKRVQPWQAKYQRDGMSPMEQDHLATRSKELAAKGGFNVLKSSTIASIQNAKQAAINLIARGEQTGNEEMRQRGFAQLGNTMPEADIEAERIKSDTRVATTQVEAAINSDPIGWRDKLEKDPNGALKNYPGIPVADIPRLQDAARGAARQSVGDSVDSFGDDIATGKIKSPEDIDRLYGTRVPPRIVEKMKGELAQRFDQEEKARMKSPEAQAQMLGEASRLMNGLADATGDDFDQRYATASFLLGKMADSPAKELLSERLRVTKSGREAEIRTHADAAMKALEDYDKAERERAGLGGSGSTLKIPGAQEMPTARAIADGFLRDWNKLKALGFSDKQASMIRDAKDSKGELDDGQAKAIFRQEWKNRESGNFGADPLTLATADAILGGSEKISYVSPEAQDEAISLRMKADQEAGERKIKLAEWLKLNPDAKREQIDIKVREIAGEQTYRKVSSGIYDHNETSGGPKGASDSTAAVPVGKDLTEIVKNFEAADGFHPQAYWDSKQWSIGYGTRSKEGEVIGQQEADKRLASELGQARKDVEAEAKRVGLTFTAHELDALTSFQFNTGRIDTLLDGGKRSKAQIAETMLLYRNADGKRLRGLENRRKAEMALFLKGYQSGKVTVSNDRNTGDLAQYNVITE